jgi:hypothetical protein
VILCFSTRLDEFEGGMRLTDVDVDGPARAFVGGVGEESSA